MKTLNTITKGNLYKLIWEGGGEIPQALSGLYTSKKTALEAGNAYIEKRDEAKNGKSSTREK